MTPWTVALQAPLFMGFSWQESWSGFPPPGDLPSPGIEPSSVPCLAGDQMHSVLCTVCSRGSMLHNPCDTGQVRSASLSRHSIPSLSTLLTTLHLSFQVRDSTNEDTAQRAGKTVRNPSDEPGQLTVCNRILVLQGSLWFVHADKVTKF